MNNNSLDPFGEKKLKQLQLWFYLLPFVGIFPALWALSRPQTSIKERAVSRLSVNLGLSWLIIYSLLWLGSFSGAEVLNFRLLFLNGLLTSGYFLACFIFMIQVWRGKNPSFK